MGTVAYRPLTVAEQVFKDLLWTPGIRAGELALEGAVPFLAFPVINAIEDVVIDAISDYLFNQFITLIDVTAIKLVNAAHQAAFDRASITLKIIAHDKGIDSPEFQKAREDAKLALSQFVRFGATT